MEFCVLASGSKANALFLRSGGVSVLIDCGLSAREVTRRLASLDVKTKDLTAIVVTHEHSDHVSGLPVLSSQCPAPIYASDRTVAYSKSLLAVPETKRVAFTPDTPFSIPPFCFEPISVDHDAAEPVAFKVTDGNHSIAVITDLGNVPLTLAVRLRDLDALVLETNHDLMLLEASPYPWDLKQRIRSNHGHLSNEQAGALLKDISLHDGLRLQCVVAAHISENSNDPQLAVDVLESYWSGSGARPQFLAASPYHVTTLFDLKQIATDAPLPTRAESARPLSLF